MYLSNVSTYIFPLIIYSLITINSSSGGIIVKRQVLLEDRLPGSAYVAGRSTTQAPTYYGRQRTISGNYGTPLGSVDYNVEYPMNSGYTQRDGYIEVGLPDMVQSYNPDLSGYVPMAHGPTYGNSRPVYTYNNSPQDSERPTYQVNGGRYGGSDRFHGETFEYGDGYSDESYSRRGYSNSNGPTYTYRSG